MQMIKTLLSAAALLAVGVHAAANSTITAAPSVVPVPPVGNNSALPGKAIPYGALREDAVGPRNVEDLMLAMTNRTNYAESVGRPICILEVKKVMVQVVAGVNYRFNVEGCSQTFAELLGPCNDGTCKSPALWEVSVFSQPWTNTYRVNSIKFLE